MAKTSRPVLKQAREPEDLLHQALLDEIEALLEEMKTKGKVTEYILFSEFGLDIAIFMKKGDMVLTRFIELKAYAGKRNGGVGFGNGRGRGCQADLLLLDTSKMEIIENSIRWVIWDSLRKNDKCFSFLSSREAKDSVMGEVEREKQNNFGIKKVFVKSSITWDQLSAKIKEFMEN